LKIPLLLNSRFCSTCPSITVRAATSASRPVFKSLTHPKLSPCVVVMLPGCYSTHSELVQFDVMWTVCSWSDWRRYPGYGQCRGCCDGSGAERAEDPKLYLGIFHFGQWITSASRRQLTSAGLQGINLYVNSCLQFNSTTGWINSSFKFCLLWCIGLGEGGYREPGIAWWPGRIKSGSFSSTALVATYDIFPTCLALAGAEAPKVHLDGIDLSPLLFSKEPGREVGHDCIMMYKHPESQLGPSGAAQLDSLAAIRCGDYKVYWYIDQGSSTPLPEGIVVGPQSLERPVIFDLKTDVSENHPIPAESPLWKQAKATAEAARVKHLQTIGWAPNQMLEPGDLRYAICADPRSQDKYPEFPNCTICEPTRVPAHPSVLRS